MLDENLPTFRFQASSDNGLSSILYFTYYGSEPVPEYIFKRADPVSQPASRSKYAAALTDTHSQDIVFGEVVVSPVLQQPTLSAAEIRSQNGVAAPSVPLVPDTFSLQLYDPDQVIGFKMKQGSWSKSDTWEFEMPTRSFRMPSASQLDRQWTTQTESDITPKIMFKWKRDGRLSKDMTCYMAGRSLGRHKSKEPDITVAMFKHGRESALTIYEPNMQRVDVEDKKGLEVVLLLGAEVIRDLYLAPRPNVFNITTGIHGSSSSPTGATANGKARKNSRPAQAPAPAPAPAIPVSSASFAPATSAHAAPAPSGDMRMPGNLGSETGTQIDAETRQLQAMVEREERERRAQAEREEKEREKRDRTEQKRIKKMLEEEEREMRRREAEAAKEVERETERLRKMYGTQGQDLPSARPSLPPRPAPQQLPHQQPTVTFAVPRPGPGRVTSSSSQVGWLGGTSPPARPVSAGPPSAGGGGGDGSWWWRGSAAPPASHPQSQPPPQSGPYLTSPYTQNPSASTSGFFHRDRRDSDNRKKMQKKRSVHF